MEDIQPAHRGEIDSCTPMKERLAESRGQAITDDNDSDEKKSSDGDAKDVGQCLSMHQPWASLLVMGIKRYEGRGWSTPFRGRLWIASAARSPDSTEIASVEAEYRSLYGEKAEIPFPTEYPPSALLGYVDMTDCLPNDKFQALRAAHPEQKIEDSISQHVFVCSNPHVMKLPQQIAGQHKLWTIPPKVLAGAQAGVKPVSAAWRFEAVSPMLAEAKKAPALDLWPLRYKPKAVPSEVKVRPDYQVLASGLVLIKNYLTMAQQQEIVDTCRGDGMGPSGFYIPTYENEARINLRMFCYGTHLIFQLSTTHLTTSLSFPFVDLPIICLVLLKHRSALESTNEAI
jgi:hypothetical protein